MKTKDLISHNILRWNLYNAVYISPTESDFPRLKIYKEYYARKVDCIWKYEVQLNGLVPENILSIVRIGTTQSIKSSLLKEYPLKHFLENS